MFRDKISVPSSRAKNSYIFGFSSPEDRTQKVATETLIKITITRCVTTQKNAVINIIHDFFFPKMSVMKCNELVSNWTMCVRLSYSLTPNSSVFLEKLNSSQLAKNFPAFYVTRKFITAFTNARHLSLSSASSIQSIPPHPTF